MTLIDHGGPNAAPFLNGVVPLCGKRPDGSRSCDSPEDSPYHRQNPQKHPARTGISIPAMLVHDPSVLDGPEWDPDWNHGVYLTGGPLVVFDFDDLTERETLAILGTQTIRESAIVQSNRGFHCYFLMPSVPDELNGNIDIVRSDGVAHKAGDLKINGYTVGPGSVHQTGHVYDYVEFTDPGGQLLWASPKLYELKPVAETSPRALLARLLAEAGLRYEPFRPGSGGAIPKVEGLAFTLTPEECPWTLSQPLRVLLKLGGGEKRRKADGTVDRSAALFHLIAEVWRERPPSPGEPTIEEFRAVAAIGLALNESVYHKPGWAFDDSWSAAQRAWQEVRAEQGRPQTPPTSPGGGAGDSGGASGGSPPVVTLLPGGAPPPQPPQEFYVAADSGYLMQRPKRPDGTLGTARKVCSFEPVVNEELRVIDRDGLQADVRYRGTARLLLESGLYEERQFDIGAQELGDTRAMARALGRLGGEYAIEARMHYAFTRGLGRYAPVERRRQRVYAETGWQDDHTFALPGVGAMTPAGTNPELVVLATGWPPHLGWYGKGMVYQPGGDHAPAWRSLLAAHDPHVVVPLTLAMFLAPHREAVSPTPLLFVKGITGAGKSTTVSLATGLYGAHDPVIERGVSSSSSAAGIENLFSIVRHLPLLLDDLKPRSGQGSVEALTAVLQSYGDNAGRTLMDRNGGLRLARIPQTFAILTGEENLLARSGATVARMVVLDLDRPEGGFTDRTALDLCRDGTLAAAGADYLQWCVERGRADIAKNLAIAHDAAVEYVGTLSLGSEHARLAANLVTFRVGHVLARAYFRARVPGFLEEYEALAATALANMEQALTQQAVNIAEATIPLGEQVLGHIRDAANLRLVAFRSTKPVRHPEWHWPGAIAMVIGDQPVATVFHAANGDRVSLIGYADDNGLYITHGTFWHWWERRYNRDAGDPGWAGVTSALSSVGVTRKSVDLAEGKRKLWSIPWEVLGLDAGFLTTDDALDAAEEILRDPEGG